MAHPKHQSVRQRYDFCCGYCGVSDVNAGGELTVDHYKPVSRGGDDSDENLVYACPRCNQYKSDYDPDANELAQGFYVLHPLRHDVSAHIRENELTGELEALTETGRFNIHLLELNRPQLIAHRRQRWLRDVSAEIREAYEQEVAEVRASLAAYERYTTILERMLGLREE